MESIFDIENIMGIYLFSLIQILISKTNIHYDANIVGNCLCFLYFLFQLENLFWISISKTDKKLSITINR